MPVCTQQAFTMKPIRSAAPTWAERVRSFWSHWLCGSFTFKPGLQNLGLWRQDGQMTLFPGHLLWGLSGKTMTSGWNTPLASTPIQVEGRQPAPVMPPSPSSLDHRLLGQGLAHTVECSGAWPILQSVWREASWEAAQVIGAHWAKQGSQAEHKVSDTETGAGWGGDGRRGHMRVQGRRLGRLVGVHVCVQKPLGGHQSQPLTLAHTTGCHPPLLPWDSEAEERDRQAVF